MKPLAARALVVSLLALVAAGTGAQPAGRRLTTIDALRQFPSYFHLQNVLLRGELVESGNRIVLRSDEQEIRVWLNDVTLASGLAEARGQLIDVGRLEPGDPRLGGYAESRDDDAWPRPGEELVLSVRSVAEAQPATSPSVRALALEPWKFVGQQVTVVGNFRGRNLFGDLPGAPRKSPYDFVLRSADGAVWVTGLRPRGRGFDLDVDRRLDSDRWLEVSGTVVHERGLVSIEATRFAAAERPEQPDLAEEAAEPPLPLLPAEVVFSSPTQDEIDVSVNTTVRIQFSRGLDETSLPGMLQVRASGDPTGRIEFKTFYDAATRALEIRFANPLEPFSTVTVALLDGARAFDGAPVRPWTLTFSVGG